MLNNIGRWAYLIALLACVPACMNRHAITSRISSGLSLLTGYDHSVPVPLGAKPELQQRDDRGQVYAVYEVPTPIGDVRTQYLSLAEREGWIIEAQFVSASYWVLTMHAPGRRVVVEAHRMPGKIERTRLTCITFLVETRIALDDEEL